MGMYKGCRFAAIGLALVAGMLTGCAGSKAEEPTGTSVSVQAEENTVYVPSFSKLEYQGAAYNYFFAESGNFYLLGTDEENNRNLSVRAIDAATGESRDLELGEKMDEYVKINDGYAGYTSYNAPKLTVYDADFAAERQIDLSVLDNRLKADGIWYSCDGCQIDADGNIGMIIGGNLYVMNGEGNIMFSLAGTQEVSQFYKLAVDGVGGMYVWGRDNGYAPVAYRIDIDKQELGEELKNLPKVEYDTIIYPSGDYGWYIVTRNNVYEYGTEDGSVRELVNLTDYGVVLNKYMCGFGVDPESRPVLIAKDAVSTAGTVDSEQELESADVIVLCEVPADSVRTRQELVLATVGNLPPQYQSRVRSFNKYNTEYYISIKNYVDEVSSESENPYDAAREKLNFDIAMGDGADLYYISSNAVNFDDLAQKGAFADLYDFIDADSELDRDMFFPNVMSELEYNGELVRISDSFTISTLIGKREVLDGIERLDVDGVAKLMSDNPGAQLFPAGNEMAALNALVLYRLDEFCDSETGDGSFTSDEFLRAMELARDIPYSTDIDYNEQIELLRGDRALLYAVNISSVKDMLWYEKMLGADVTYIGYPMRDASGNLICVDSCFAVSGVSEHKDEAWELVREFLMLDAQKAVLSIPVRTDAFEQMLEESDEKEVSYGYGDVFVGIKESTDEQKQAYSELVYLASGMGEYDTELYAIIEEEMQSFFAGARGAEETAAVIQNRAKLYLDEKN